MVHMCKEVFSLTVWSGIDQNKSQKLLVYQILTICRHFAVETELGGHGVKYDS